MATKDAPPPIPQIVSIKLSELIIDNSLSGRTDKEIKDNAKSLVAMLDAYGGWDPKHPGEYFVRDGKKHLAAGFTRVVAALLGGYKEGYFVECADNRQSLLITCITSNAGQPISRYEQGRIYTQMRDGDDPATLAKGQEAMAPMDIKAISAVVGYTRQHIEACMAIYASSPEIAELIVSGKISSNIAIKAAQQVKDQGKRLKYLKAAIAAAKADGKDVATLTHLDKVRPDFAPLKVNKPESKPAEATEKKNDTPPLAGLGDLGSTSDKQGAESSEDESIIEVEPGVTGKGKPGSRVTTVTTGAEVAPRDKKESSAQPPSSDPTELQLAGIEFDIHQWTDETDTVVDDKDIRDLAVIMFNRGAR